MVFSAECVQIYNVQDFSCGYHRDGPFAHPGAMDNRKTEEMSLTQQIRDDGPKAHMGKAGTPTMGGLLIILCILLSVLMWGDLKNMYIWTMILSLVGFGTSVFLMITLKIIRKSQKGLRAYQKFGLQIVLALMIGIFLYINPKDPYTDVLSVPFFKRWLFELGLIYIPFSVLVMVGSSNAVNLTDGIDGLAIGLVAVAVLGKRRTCLPVRP